MTQHFIGVDLGSHTVKGVVLRQGFRGGQVVRAVSEPVSAPSAGESEISSMVDAAGRLVSGLNLPDAFIHIALPGEWVSIHRIELPLAGARRAREVLAFELDERLPFDVEDATFDYIEESRNADTVSFLVVATRSAQLEELLALLSARGIDPAAVSAQPLSYFAQMDGEGGQTVAVVDLGHGHTQIAIMGKGLYSCRSALRGGADLTAHLALVGNVDPAVANQHKEQTGLTGRIGEVLQEGFSPLLREIRQTFSSHEAAGGVFPERVLLCGGGAQMVGVQPFLEQELGIPVGVVELTLGDALATSNTAQWVLASNLARFSLLPRSLRLNLRTGALAFKGDAELARRQALTAVFCVLAVVASWIFYQVARYAQVSADTAQVRAVLEETTLRAIGKKTVDRTLIERKIGPKRGPLSPIPVRDAFEIVVELSKRIPDTVVHDVEQLEVKPKQIKLRGVVNSELTEDARGADADLSPTDLIKSKLAEFDECFTAFRIPKVRTIKDRQQYTMEIESKCP